MAFQEKKFLDAEGITHLVKLLDEYPNNQVLGTVIDAIEGELAQKYEKPAGGIPASDIAQGVIPVIPTIDNAPTSGSNNLVKSGGVAAALSAQSEAIDGKEDKPGLVVEFTVTVQYSMDGSKTWSVTANKTVQEVATAYNAGTKIKCIVHQPAIGDADSIDDVLTHIIGFNPTSEITMVIAYAGLYFDGIVYLLIGGTAAPEGTMPDVNVWQIQTSEPLQTMDGGDFIAYNKKIMYVADPTSYNHAATKGYVDTQDATKLTAPSTAGTSGQVLTSDGNGGQVWQTPAAGGAEIDDTARAGDTDKAWSADKLTTELAGKEDVPDFVVEFTLTPPVRQLVVPGSEPASNEWSVASNKTVAEVLTAYNAGEKIKATYIINDSGNPLNLTGELNLSVQSFSGMTIVIAMGFVFAEGAILVMVMGMQGQTPEWAIQTSGFLEYNSIEDAYDALDRKIVALGAPTQSDDAATKGYVDTGLATKEDKPGLVVTFTATLNQNTWSIASDKTVAEVLQAVSDGKTIKCQMVQALGVVDIETDLPSPIIVRGQILVFARTAMNGAPRDIMITGIQGRTPEWIISIVENIGAIDGSDFSAENKKITSLAAPTASTDAATKGYVDTAVGSKLDAPSTAGASGQVLTSDGQGGQSWQTPAGGVSDVQVNGTSVVDAQGVAEIPQAASNVFGVVRAAAGAGLGIGILGDGRLYITRSTTGDCKTGTQQYAPVTPAIQDHATFYGLAKAAGSDEKNSALPMGQYTETAKSAIHAMLNGPVSVSGTTPSITALDGVRYVCGEVSTLDITLPASGCVDVVFESGSTPTVLTITPPTGQTVKWANGFDPTSLEANTTYEINILDGLGVGGAWS